MTGNFSTPSRSAHYDLLLVGGGLQNGLIALACLARDPALRIALVERSATIGGNHTWSIHPHDVPEEARSFVDPLVSHRWGGYDVCFPNFSRTLDAPYASISSPRFAAVVANALSERAGCRLLLGREARAVRADRVQLDGGESLHASLVIDARGPAAHAASSGSSCGFQKFVGVEVELEAEHGLSRPILMDATVPQTDGFRFFYVLPFGPRRLLVEDTVFSRSPVLDVARTRASALAHAEHFGRVRAVCREEIGVLPMPWASAPPPAPASPLLAGYQGGWFHPATGYSLASAVRLACHVARNAPDRVLGDELAELQRQHRSQARYAQVLNRLLFHCFAPEQMRNVFERFYRLPEALIHRFYALTLTPLDRARILVGRPPRGLSLARAFSESP